MAGASVVAAAPLTPALSPVLQPRGSTLTSTSGPLTPRLTGSERQISVTPPRDSGWTVPSGDDTHAASMGSMSVAVAGSMAGGGSMHFPVSARPTPPATPSVPMSPGPMHAPTGVSPGSHPAPGQVLRVVNSPASLTPALPEVPVLPLHVLQVQSPPSPRHGYIVSTSASATASQPASTMPGAASSPGQVAPLSARSRANSAGPQRCSTYPGPKTVVSGRTTANSSNSSIQGAATRSTSGRPRSAQSRMTTYSYHSGGLQANGHSNGAPPAAQPRLATARGRAATQPGSPVAITSWGPRQGRFEATTTVVSTRIQSPRATTTVMSPRVLSPFSPTTSPVTSPRRDGSVTHRQNELSRTWQDLLEMVVNSRPGNEADEAASSVDGEGNRPRDHLPPDPGRTRRACQSLVGVINRMPDDLFKRVLIVLVEELFNAIFRDYQFSFDPRLEKSALDTSRVTSPGRMASQSAVRPPRLSEECLVDAVPYSAVVQSLRDAAKDAIMRRLELEARLNSESGPPTSVGEKSCSTLIAEDLVEGGRGSDSFHMGNGNAAAGREVNEELRQTKAMVEAYHQKTVELERARLATESELQRTREALAAETAKRLSEEARQHREGAVHRAIEAERHSQEKLLNGERGQHNVGRRKAPMVINPPSGDRLEGGHHTGLTREDLAEPKAPAEEDIPPSRLRGGHSSYSTGGGGGAPSRGTMRSPRDRTGLSGGGGSVSSSSMTNLGSPKASADAAAGGGVARLRRVSANGSRTQLMTGSASGGLSSHTAGSSLKSRAADHAAHSARHSARSPIDTGKGWR
eukprot:TRINITY_DN44932_c0_g1_i1.p1 TRINITY_DN44932_c0_g1~~TRINITY_DN44932_c0_g1_i1.p1  ORF type:complete len:804 (+),score=134.90 TRINITY_DN44932_c0_g1_i1:104-2515(+)